MEKEAFWNFVRENIIGKDDYIQTAFGKKKITYADFTSSGRCVEFIEDYLKSILRLYGNTHTSDNTNGSITSERLLYAEQIIKRSFNAEENYVVIASGTGTSGAIHRLQKILGIYLPPAFKSLIEKLLNNYPGKSAKRELEAYLIQQRPVVFIGPYEHNSNVISWRECFAEVIDIDLDEDGLFDLKDLAKKVSKKEYSKRLKIGSFSAASNVTGIKSPLFDIARILHDNDSYAFFDCAAIAPYNRISVFQDEENYLDGIFLSPHKFLGGPGSSGILIIHEKIYKKNLPPTCAAGGTVDFVNLCTQDYSENIEEREKPGTPGIIQIMKAAIALELKESLCPEEIEKKEAFLLERAFDYFRNYPNIEIVGNPDPEKRIAIISFNIKDKNAYLHPKYVARLLNDLFGIQSRAGCLCAGSYAHRLFKIHSDESDTYREMIHNGHKGMLPGWTRINLHFLITDDELDFICKAIVFVSQYGKHFLSVYRFDIHNGNWEHISNTKEKVTFGLSEALNQHEKPRIPEAITSPPYDQYLEEAFEKAKELEKQYSSEKLKVTCGEIFPFFSYDHGS